MRDGNELLLLHTAILSLRETSSDAVLALRAVTERVAEDEDRIARLELLIDHINELHPGVVDNTLAELGWDDV